MHRIDLTLSWPGFLVRVALLVALTVPHFGCLALNIPSDRFHDPGDGGGVLGGWNHGLQSHQSDCHCSECGVDRCGLDGGPLESDPFDPALDHHGKPIAPEIPWPRFHPVPTRPIFGAPQMTPEPPEEPPEVASLNGPRR